MTFKKVSNCLCNGFSKFEIFLCLHFQILFLSFPEFCKINNFLSFTDEQCDTYKKAFDEMFPNA